MSRARSIKPQTTWFSFPKPWHNHREKASYFLNHVDLGVIELQALKKKKRRVPMVEMIWAKIKKEIMYE